MIKIRLLISFFLILCPTVYSSIVFSETTDDLYKKVFGKNKAEEKEVRIDATLGEFFLGEIIVELEGEKITKITLGEVGQALIDKIRDDRIAKYKISLEKLTPESLPFKVIYYPSEMRVSLEVPTEDLKPLDANVFDDLAPRYSRKADEPAPFSVGFNYKIEDVRSEKLSQPDYLQTQVDSFMNIKKVSFENQMNYLSLREKQWVRQSSRMIYDRPSRMQRFEVGDINYPIIGYQQAIGMGGFSFYKDFSLNPYRMVTPTSSFEYQIESRSLVKTYVNNILLKTEYMSPGSYSVKDIPLNNGINKIMVEMTDEFGVKKVLTFNDSASLDLLATGVSRYALAGGYPSEEDSTGRNYKDINGALISGFYQHGLKKHWTTSLYLQRNDKYSMMGTNQILSSDYGNWSFDLAGTSNKFNRGYVTQGTYQLNLFGSYWYDSHTLTTKLEYRSPWFSEAGENFINRFDWTATASYSVPFFQKFNVAFGGSYKNPTLAEGAQIAYNGSFTTKVFDSSSLTLFAGRSRDEIGLWSNQMYFFFNMSFGESSTFSSAFYDRTSQTRKLTVIRDTGKKYNDIKISAQGEESVSTKQGSLDLQYNTVLADMGARQEIIKTKGGGEGYRRSFRMLSSMAFVHNGKEAGFSIARPISNSFVIFKPNSDWKGQQFGVQTSSGVNDTTTGLFGESLVSGLTPYQYRRLQLDPSRLAPGYVLGQESFVVYPRKNSGHLYVVGRSGLVVLTGRLVNKNGEPQSLKVGTWTSSSGKNTLFFTGRDGEFFIEGIEIGIGLVQIDEKYESLQVDLSSKKQGIVEIGDLILIEKK